MPGWLVFRRRDDSIGEAAVESSGGMISHHATFSLGFYLYLRLNSMLPLRLRRVIETSI